MRVELVDFGIDDLDVLHIWVSWIDHYVPRGRPLKESLGLPNGHRSVHRFLVDDFVRSCLTGNLTPNNVWQAATYLLPGSDRSWIGTRGGDDGSTGLRGSTSMLSRLNSIGQEEPETCDPLEDSVHGILTITRDGARKLF